MYCSKCGKEMPDEAVVCTGCGCLLHKKEELQTVNKGDGESRVQNENFMAHVSADRAEKQLQNKAVLFAFIALSCLWISMILMCFGLLVFAVIAIIFALSATVAGLISALIGIKQRGLLALRLLTILILILSFTCFVIAIQKIF